VLALIDRAQHEKLTGSLTLSFRHGEIRHMKAEQVHFAPQPDGHLCPRGCGPMEGRDGNTMWVCPDCQTKRTAAQWR
jgi:hypothetical protein